MKAIAEALREATARLARAGVEGPALEARLLLAHALGEPVERLLIDRRRIISTESFDALLARRVTREPLAFMTGHREFWSLDFEVGPATLIPRNDSETLIEAALAATTAPSRILDLGTGSGCLLLAALHEFPAAWGLGIDRSPAAVALAHRNARRLTLADRSAFLCGDWAAAIAGRFDLVLCNPPYIPSADIAGLMPEVARHEPATALDGGADGLDAVRLLLADLPRLLTPTGVGIIEIGFGQDEAALRLAQQAGFSRPALRADLGGVPRALVLPAD
jgi:release factor glutamine methyltransferase